MRFCGGGLNGNPMSRRIGSWRGSFIISGVADNDVNSLQWSVISCQFCACSY